MKPLHGVRIVELYSRGPLQHAGMLLADFGAEITTIARPGEHDIVHNQMMRGREFEFVDLKASEGRAHVLELVEHADVVLEGYRPGVIERLGLGPADLAARNPRIIVGRMTGWGQSGPLAQKGGHDINYIAETGALWATRTAGARPTVALNMVGDNGGGSLYLVTGVLAALLERNATGRGSVIDAAIVDGATSLLETVRGLKGEGIWSDDYADNIFDTGAPYYDTYECADGEYLAVGAIEPKFYRAFVETLGFDARALPDRDDRTNWPQLRERFTSRLRERSLADWEAAFADVDACVSPVRPLPTAHESAHVQARGSLRETANGRWTTAAAPRLTPLPAPGETRPDAG